MTVFRPCIDLHQGRVKQIVGGTLGAAEAPKTNFVASEGAAHFARLYRRDGLSGGHLILLGPGNDAAALDALRAWPGGLQLGGGITADNAAEWLAAGASKVIVTSWLFDGVQLQRSRLERLSQLVGTERLVIDLSCRRRGRRWFVATNRWQTVTELEVSETTLRMLSEYCSEFLVHAADVEGLCQGIDEALVSRLAQWSPIPCTYAGGGREIGDLARVAALSDGKVDLTFGSALDIFGGSGVRYLDCVRHNQQPGAPSSGQ